MKLLRQFAVWLLMLTLPLQAVAAFAPVMPCTGGHAPAIAHPHDSHAHHQAMTDSGEHPALPCCDHQQGNSGSGNKYDGHSCCHQVFTGAASVILPLEPETPRVITARISLLNTLFIPELPQRPPRA
jgi:hypothetical protein